MSKLISYGSSLHNQLIANHTQREKTWGNIVSTNDKGVVTNALGALKYDDYKELTDEVVEVRKFESVGNFYRTLTGSPGMSRSMNIGKTLIDYKDMNSFGDATTSMDASNREAEQNNYDQRVVPLPIFHKDFLIPWRQEGFSYKQSDGVSESMFRVMETRDKVLINGAANINVNGTELYGYTNHPATIKEAGILDLADPANATDAYNVFVTLTKRLFTDAKVAAPNSVAVFVANDVWASLQFKSSDTKSNDLTIAEDIARISQIRDVQPNQELPDGAILMVELNPRSSDIAVASDVIALPWQRMNQLEDLRFTIIASCTPRIKTDRNGKTGILYATKA